jgi:hypothetical protein
MKQKIAPVLVSYHTIRWIKVGIRSYLKYFPKHQIIVVDNNPDPGDARWTSECEQERDFLNGCPNVLLLKNESRDKSHGSGIDNACSWCRNNGVELMLHFEPDCLIQGTVWFEELLANIEKGASMTGSHRKSYGPIHITPSIWNVKEVIASFTAQPRKNDMQHPLFHKLVDMRALKEEIVNYDKRRWFWHAINWDTAQKNWFNAAVQGKAVLARETGDFHHYWGGSAFHRNHHLLNQDSQMSDLLYD